MNTNIALKWHSFCHLCSRVLQLHVVFWLNWTLLDTQKRSCLGFTNIPHHSRAWFTRHEGQTMHPHRKYCNITACVYFVHRWVLSCFPACWPAWLLWRSVWLWTVTIRSCWSSPQSQYPYRSDMPPASGEMHSEQRRTRATLRPIWHQALGRANKPEGKQKKIKLCWCLGDRFLIW